MRRREEKEKAAQGEAVRRAPGRLCTAAATGALRGAGSGFSTLRHTEEPRPRPETLHGLCEPCFRAALSPRCCCKTPSRRPAGTAFGRSSHGPDEAHAAQRNEAQTHFCSLKTPAPVPNTTCPALDGGLQEVGHPRRLLQPRRRKKPGTRTRIIEAGRMLYLGGAGGVRGNRVWLSDEEQQLRLQPGVGEICAYGQHALGAKARPRGR